MSDRGLGHGLESDSAGGDWVAPGNLDPKSLEDGIGVDHGLGDVSDVAGGVVGARREGGAPCAGLVDRPALGGLAAAEELDQLVIVDLEGDEADGE